MTNPRKIALYLTLACGLLAPSATVLADHTGTLPGNTEIIVRDYTSDRYDGMVAKAYEAWAEILPDPTTTFTVIDEGHTDCKELGGVDGAFDAMPENEIWVCSRKRVGGKSTTGMTWTAGGGGVITKNYIEVENGARGKQALISHETGHSLNLDHTSRKNSVMRTGRDKPNLPTDVDAELLADLYE